MRVELEGKVEVEVKHDDLILKVDSDTITLETDLEDFTRKVMAAYRYQKYLELGSNDKADDQVINLMLDVCISDVFEEFQTRIKTLEEELMAEKEFNLDRYDVDYEDR